MQALRFGEGKAHSQAGKAGKRGQEACQADNHGVGQLS